MVRPATDGWGKATERSYFYAKGEYTHGSAALADVQRTQCSADDLECNEDQGVTDRQPLDVSPVVPLVL